MEFRHFLIYFKKIYHNKSCLFVPFSGFFIAMILLGGGMFLDGDQNIIFLPKNRVLAQEEDFVVDIPREREEGQNIKSDNLILFSGRIIKNSFTNVIFEVDKGISKGISFFGEKFKILKEIAFVNWRNFLHRGVAGRGNNSEHSSNFQTSSIDDEFIDTICREGGLSNSNLSDIQMARVLRLLDQDIVDNDLDRVSLENIKDLGFKNIENIFSDEIDVSWLEEGKSGIIFPINEGYENAYAFIIVPINK